jgi:hypothetical protein
LQREIAASTVCSRSPKRLASSVRAGRNDVTDLDHAVGDDHAVDQQLEQRPLPLEVRVGVGRQPGRLSSAVGHDRRDHTDNGSGRDGHDRIIVADAGR